MIVAIVGYRHFNDWPIFKEVMQEFVTRFGMPHQIISGGAPGADKLAERWAAVYKIDTIIHPADWRKYGDLAGPIRNTTLAKEATHMVAFPSKRKGRGTQDSIRKFRMHHGDKTDKLMIHELP